MNKILIALLLLLSSCSSSNNATQPNNSEENSKFDEKKILSSVFEVVVKKETESNIKYENDDIDSLIPFKIRNDKYKPIGTAFLTKEGTLLSALHVFNLMSKSLYGDVFVRNADGKIFTVDEVIKFSISRDFLEFTVKEELNYKGIEFDDNFEVGEEVYTIGNALGEGIVIRNGLLSSNSPEEVDGKWNWIRFSAPASPGNSGGPLVNKKGKVIGIVLRKSPNENLNYAIPISEVKKLPKNTADTKSKLIFKLLNIEGKNFIDTMDVDIELPKKFKTLRKELTTKSRVFIDKMKDQYYEKHKDSLFPNGQPSQLLLSVNFAKSFPSVIGYAGGQFWDAFSPQNIQTATLADGVRLKYGGVGSFTLIRVIKPEKMLLKDLITDEKVSNMFATGLSLKRQFSQSEVNITEIGKPIFVESHLDEYQRRWKIKTWPVRFGNIYLLTINLLMPDGFITFAMYSPQEHYYGFIEDLKDLANYLAVSFRGANADWEAYLKRDEIPDLFKKMKINSDSIEVGAFKAPFTPKNKESTHFIVTPNYFTKKDKVLWDVTELVVQDFDANEFASITRYPKYKIPAQALIDEWEKITKSKAPYDKKIIQNEDKTYIFENYKNEEDAVYYLNYIAEGNNDQKTMEKKLDKFKSRIKIKERN